MDTTIINHQTLRNKELLQKALACVAANCDGGLSTDGKGFARADVEIGHSLADTRRSALNWTERQTAVALILIKKYRRQVVDAAPDLDGISELIKFCCSVEIDLANVEDGDEWHPTNGGPLVSVFVLDWRSRRKHMSENREWQLPKTQGCIALVLCSDMHPGLRVKKSIREKWSETVLTPFTNALTQKRIDFIDASGASISMPSLSRDVDCTMEPTPVNISALAELGIDIPPDWLVTPPSALRERYKAAVSARENAVRWLAEDKRDAVAAVAEWAFARFPKGSLREQAILISAFGGGEDVRCALKEGHLTTELLNACCIHAHQMCSIPFGFPHYPTDERRLDTGQWRREHEASLTARYERAANEWGRRWEDIEMGVWIRSRMTLVHHACPPDIIEDALALLGDEYKPSALPMLRGSEQQIGWSTAIRAQRISQFERGKRTALKRMQTGDVSIASHPDAIARRCKELKAILAAYAKRYRVISEATWWIDHRFCSDSICRVDGDRLSSAHCQPACRNC
ncbi:MAG: hypothetical protein PHY45_05795 [Rhodocyclaceae bacterium]|nr:hypothetical protein [Rhodocyclaceae bacterium]